MGRHQYRTVAIENRTKGAHDWVARGDPTLVGMQAILDAFGSEGWALVSRTTEASEVMPGFGRWYLDTTVYGRPSGGH